MSFALLALWIVSPTLTSDDTLRERYDLLLKEYNAMELGWTHQFKEPGLTLEESIKRYEQWPAWTYLPKFHLIVEEDPADPAAGDALFWILDITRDSTQNDRECAFVRDRCLELLEASPFVEDERMKMAYRWSLRRPTPAAERFTRHAVEKTRNREIRAHALLALGNLLQSKAQLARAPWFENLGPGTFPGFLASRIDPAVRTYLKQADPDAALAEAVTILRRAITDYGDVLYFKNVNPAARSATIGDVAVKALAEVQAEQVVAVGRPALEIEGTDLDGKPLSLSDYRGKVVVLFFWSAKSPASLEIVPALRELAIKQKTRPFVVLGVNTGDEREAGKAASLRMSMPWPSWWDKVPGIPIAATWRASELPTIYLIDRKGTAQYKGRGEKGGLESALEVFEKRPAKGENPKP